MQYVPILIFLLVIAFIRVIFQDSKMRIKREGGNVRVRLTIGEIIFVRGWVIGVVMGGKVRFWRICRSLVLRWRWVN